MKIHLADSDVPLIEGGDLMAVCGEIVPKAQFPFFAEIADCPIGLRMTRICPACWEHGQGKKRYLYGLVSGQEAELPSAEDLDLDAEEKLIAERTK